MGPTLRGVLAIDETLVVFPVRIGVRNGDFNVVVDQVNNGVPRIFIEVVAQQVLETVVALELFTVQVQRERGIQVGVVPQQALHMLHAVAVGLEHLAVRSERNHGAVAFFGLAPLFVVDQFTTLEFGALDFTFPVAFHGKMSRKGIHSLGTHTIQSNRLLESTGIVLTTGVDFGNNVHHFAEWNATAKVPDLDLSISNGNAHALAVAHGMFIDAVVDDFF